MKIMRVTYYALAALLSAASCSKEAAEPDVYDRADGKIYFRTSLCDVVSSRAQDMTLDHLESFQVTCFNSADKYKDQSGYLLPYFENATFIRQENGTYESSPNESPHTWPVDEGFMNFLAFSPSIAVMSDDNSALEDVDRSQYFKLINTTGETESRAAVGYRLGKMRINPDISKQYDFVTAEASGERLKDFMGGIDLAFRHQLCQVELRAWGTGKDNNFEIAGVRLGNPVVEGTYIFADPAKSRGWEGNTVNDNVEYLYRNTDTTEDTPIAGDRIFKINSREHNTQESAGSLMGLGGCAMVIPTINSAWEGLADANIGSIPYKTGKMYFSILMRVTDPYSGSVIYPYPENPSKMTVVSYAVDREENIVARLYAGETKGTYFTDSELRNPYVATEGVVVKDFGWAAVPVDANWSAGKKYIYTLNYSEGIGLHDPADPEPGKPIKGQSTISWGVSVSGWNVAEKNENYDPDLDVPE